MLPLELLRTRTSGGKITPLFCEVGSGGSGGDYGLADKLITHFANAQKTGESKGSLLEKTALLESEHDYKLVRGLSALLERRSVFGSSPSTVASPVTVRRRLFEESSARGLALSDSQRQDIIRLIASQMRLLPGQVEATMWSDRDDNLATTRFDSVSPKDLILWYNLSLAQTLLFRCTGLEFHVKGGLYWKQALRSVKRYGLMYHLEHSPDDSIKCVLEGALSLFKMTDRYGTAMAKALPSIVSAPEWEISGSIVRKTGDGQKIYQFELSSKTAAGLFHSASGAACQNSGGGAGNDDDHVYDSAVEAQFAKTFRQYFGDGGRLGWKISREPDPLIADGKAMIPDFLFERFGRKVYLEIVGFWTKEYLERKAQKLRALLPGTGNADSTGIDLLVAVNSELACSQMGTISSDRVFTFKKNVPIKPILEHLKKIDKAIVEEKVKTTRIRLDGQDLDLIPAGEVAAAHGVPDEAALQIIAADHPRHLVVGTYLISKERIDAIKQSLRGISEFIEACKVLTFNKIPDSCQADLLSKLGYNVVWSDLNPNNATIVEE